MWLKLAIFRGFGHIWGVIDYVVIFLIFITGFLSPIMNSKKSVP
jgi:hypothetical protein